eukprot:g576.t1
MTTSFLRNLREDLQAKILATNFPKDNPKRLDIVKKAFTSAEKECVKNSLTRAEAQSTLELALRKIAIHLGQGDPKVVGFENFLDLTMVLAEEKITSPHTTINILEDVLSSQTIPQCQILWQMLEARRNEISSPVYFGSVPGRNTKSKLALLRLSNALLRRFSKTNDTEFVGRVLMFLAYICPLSERSGVNVSGHYNATNVTSYEGEGMEVDEVSDKNDNTAESESPIDYNLYKNFWEIQNKFSSPNEVMKSETSWKQFIDSMERVITAFEGHTFTTSNSKDKYESQNQNDQEDTVYYYCTKYLTKKSLLRLQLRDPVLRRHVLLQLLVIFQYFQRLCDDSGSNMGKKTKASTTTTANTAAKATSLRQKQQLQMLGAAKTLPPYRKRVYTLLRNTPPNGAAFLQSAKNILSRELFWSQWKENRCPPYDRPPVVGKVPKAKRKRLDDVDNERKLKKAHTMYAEADNLSCLTNSSRVSVPSEKAFLQQFRDAMDPENCIEDEYHPKHDPLYCWRGLRLLSKTNIEAFFKIESTDSLESALSAIDGEGSVKTKSKSVPSPPASAVADEVKTTKNPVLPTPPATP